MSISDLNEKEALRAASQLRSNWKLEPANEEDLEESVSLVGGRLSHLNQVSILFRQSPNKTHLSFQVSRSKDVVDKAKRLIATEKGWLLSKIGTSPLL